MSDRPGLELWGGIECTLARIGDRYRNQIDETGHRARLDDLDRIAGLGIRTLRYPVLWEDVAPDGPDSPRWEWHDGRLRRLQDLGIEPILGLVHHGSGPRYTSLLDPAFPERLAGFAEEVARRYPWVRRFTPVNEPLTTARFSCLYGHWYPHHTSHRDFLLALVQQCRGVVAAMAAIRRVTPGAELVQTEDCGRVFSTPRLAYQAAHENERRWLSFDLLFGRVDRHHPAWRLLLDHGVGEPDLQGFLDADARPDIVGINHYLTSDRFLDENIHLYPAHLAGGNGRDVYADVEAVRVALAARELGPAARLREAWERYRAPIAVTEVHHGCTRDEQLRWLMEVWTAARDLRREGADMRAVTAWSLFGTVDWNSLLTRRTGIYEPGIFDGREPVPRATALAAAVSSLARHGTFDHPVLDGPAWWRRPARLHVRGSGHEPAGSGAPRLLLIRGTGPAQRALGRAAEARGLATYQDVPGGATLAAAAVARGEIWGIVDPIDPGEMPGTAPDRAALIGAASASGAAYILVSTGEVFSGGLGRAALESDRPDPAGGAGAHALAQERLVRERYPAASLIRTGHRFGPDDPEARPWTLTVSSDGSLPGDPDLSLTFLPDLAHVALDLLIDREAGLRHLVSGTAARSEIRNRVAPGRHGATAGLSVRQGGTAERLWPGTLATERGQLMPPLEAALDRFLAELPDVEAFRPPLPREAA